MQDIHKRALEKLDRIIDLEHVRSCEQVHSDAWMGRTPRHVPCYISYPTPSDWPQYPFKECWDDLEKNFMSAMADTYRGALLKDDRLYTLSPNYGVVNIPELFGVPSDVTNEGCSMSKGVHDTDQVRTLIERGVPDIHTGHGVKIEAFVDFALETLRQYENLTQTVHMVVPDNQSPFDLAHQIWGHEMLVALYDTPEVVHQLLDLTTATYIEFTRFYKRKVGEPLDSGYHIAGVKLTRGGVHLSDDSATLCCKAAYGEFVKPYNLRALAPFRGGWLHYCGNGNHILDDMLTTSGVNAIHLGNPDHCDLYELYQKTRAGDVVLIWSGSLDRIGDVLKLNGAQGGAPRGLIVLTENRYASPNLEEARKNLERIRGFKSINRAPY